ncbi:MAG: hypothetical protein FWG72_03400 [Oscillospiraceae bacterium]|nr:hypothetical protein [Oscillospiraceae bacterium]
MARCERCGKEGCEAGDLCHACRNQLTYYYVNKTEKKRVKRSIRDRIRSWWWPLNPKRNPKHERRAVIAAVLTALILAGLLFFHIKSRGAPETGPRESYTEGAGITNGTV